MARRATKVASTAKIVAGLATFPPSPGKTGRNDGENPHRHSAIFRKAFAHPVLALQSSQESRIFVGKVKENIMNGMQLKAELLYEVSNMEENPQLLKKALACIREICGKSAYHTEEALTPYTLEELNMRAAEAEEAYRRGECLSAEEVDRELEEFMRRL